jgi:CubicO group peptidase (beta-lactamase class C family)
MRFFRKLGLALAALAMPAIAQAPSELRPKLPLTSAKPVSAPATLPTVNNSPASLTKADVDAWLDGFMPYALASGDIPGAVVVVVKDGQVLTERGFGYSDRKARTPVDPEKTLFRPGSISKLFTWTAVMQQVQAGKIDLDADVNTYLDFKIPPAFGKPITMRNLMTHTAGFEETVKYLITANPKIVKALGPTLERWVPNRIYAPGTMPAYSNYGASLAGYIVQRVSGEKFEDYIQHHIMVPLGMTRSSFAQPLPANLLAGMSKAYEPGKEDPRPYELIPLSPAGALAATGGDMAKFMIAHLSNGGPLLNPETAHLMYAPANTAVPGLPPMALGFYHEDRNGQVIIAHGGDTNYFHSDLHLYLQSNTGFFVSFNSPGKEGAAHTVRTRLFHEFTDRYFPQKPVDLPTTATAKEHGAAMAGHYYSSRGSQHNWLKFISVIGETKVSLNPDNTITVSDFVDPAHNPKKWREVGPWQWQEVGGTAQLNAVVKDGKVQSFLGGDLPQILLFLPASAGMNAGWIMPALFLSLGVSLLMALGWPVVVLIRRNYGYKPVLSGRALQLHRAARITAWLFLAVAIGWVMIVGSISSNLEAFNGGMDLPMRLLQLLTLVATIGTALSCWNAYVAFTASDRRWWKYGWAGLFALCGLFLVWLAFAMHLVTASLNY